MKKYIFLFIIITILFINNQVRTVAKSTEPLMNHYDTTTPIRFKNTGSFVTVPIKLDKQRQQFRGMYVYTNNNQDFERSLTIEEFKQQFYDVLNVIKQNNMNTIIFEIRPNNDAFYKSKLNPMSKFLFGEEGKDLGWDPLKWMITTTHSNGISFYAGFNVFKVSNITIFEKEKYLSLLHESNYAYLHPDDVMQSNYIENYYQYFLNPGKKSVQDFVYESIMEVVKNYEIDAITLEGFHYPIEGVYADGETYQETNNDKSISLEKWRRNNLTELIKKIKMDISHLNDKNNQYIKLGIIAHGDFEYSDEFLYADTKHWIEEEYIDYVIPEVKWEFEDESYPYADVVQSWTDSMVESQVNLYIGHYVHQDLRHANQIINQLRFNENYDQIDGSMFFGYKTIMENNKEEVSKLLTELQNNYWNQIALHPKTLTLDDDSPNSVSRLLVTYVNGQVDLSWKSVSDAKAYLIYRFSNEDEINLNDTSHIISILNQSPKETIYFVDHNISSSQIYRYIIVTVDHAYNVSQPVIFDIDLSPNEMFNAEMWVFIISSSIAFIVICFSAFKLLRQSK